ncbi:hypothetical protein [Amycolatopsis palatopharyngis]|uniref:hypothetical protein n=1 Tax=Amycolatopsis palatopharyngis TaxID=187982 RepID=UPI000E262E45|nr:hypothetical protein [Amycolatopsis palatopharyngis]
MSLLSRDQILEAKDITSEDVDVPEWGGTVRVMALSGWERDKFEAAMVAGKGKNRTVTMDNVRAKMAAASIVNEDGQRLFSESDVRELGKKSAAALQKVFKTAQRLSGLTDDDAEELAGNSEAGVSASSTSA